MMHAHKYIDYASGHCLTAICAFLSFTILGSSHCVDRVSVGGKEMGLHIASSSLMTERYTYYDR